MDKLKQMEQAKSIIDNCANELRDMESNVFISQYQQELYFKARTILRNLSFELGLNIMSYKEKEEIDCLIQQKQNEN